jgi:hypothetical protein
LISKAVWQTVSDLVLAEGNGRDGLEGARVLD